LQVNEFLHGSHLLIGARQLLLHSSLAIARVTPSTDLRQIVQRFESRIKWQRSLTIRNKVLLCAVTNKDPGDSLVLVDRMLRSASCANFLARHKDDQTQDQEHT